MRGGAHTCKRSMEVKTSDTEYLKTRTEALIKCLREAKENDLGPRGSENTIYTLASRVARSTDVDTKTLAADLAHKLEIEYPRLSANLFTHSG